MHRAPGRGWLRDLRPEPTDPPATPATPATPQCEPATLAAAAAQLGEDAAAWAVQTAEVVAREALAAGSSPRVEDPAGDARLLAVRRVCESCILAMLVGLVNDLPPAEVQIPPEARQSSRETVHVGIPLERMLRTMWSAHLATLERLLTELEQRVDGAAGTAEARRIRQLSFAYLNAFSDWMTAEYTTERGIWAKSMAAARRHTVDELVAGRRVVAAVAERTLGLRLTDHHLAVVIWPDDDRSPPADEQDAADRLAALMAALAAAAEADGVLSVDGAPSNLWGWLSWRRRPNPGLVPRLHALVPPPVGVRAAIGPVSPGAAGFRRSHLAALEAQRVGSAASGWLAAYPQVAVLSLLTMNAEHARWFVAETLGELTADTVRTAELRSTLLAYLAAGRSRTGAAQALHISPGTVAYRVKQAEEILGGPVIGTGRDLQLALEIAETRSGRYMPGQ